MPNYYTIHNSSIHPFIHLSHLLNELFWRTLIHHGSWTRIHIYLFLHHCPLPVLSRRSRSRSRNSSEWGSHGRTRFTRGGRFSFDNHERPLMCSKYGHANSFPEKQTAKEDKRCDGQTVMGRCTLAMSWGEWSFKGFKGWWWIWWWLCMFLTLGSS